MLLSQKMAIEKAQQQTACDCVNCEPESLQSPQNYLDNAAETGTLNAASE